MLEWITDPSAWVGLFTLVVLEIVLGIDNLVFIAILADKLPPALRDRARVTGLSLALLMRLLLLASIAWLVTLTKPLFILLGQGFSGRDLILLVGGLFLLCKATIELHECLEGGEPEHSQSVLKSSFALVVTQIVVLDAVFSLDSVITAVGITDHLEIMMIAVIIAMIIMLVSSKALTSFVTAHPTLIMLCLGFLLMIGFSLMAEGFGFHIPKGYLYAAIGFSLLIELFNQLARTNRRKWLSQRGSRRDRIASAVLHLIGGQKVRAELKEAEVSHLNESVGGAGESLFQPEERRMIHGVLMLTEKMVREIMVLRRDISFLLMDESEQQQRARLAASSHSILVAISEGQSDEPLGIIRKNDLLDIMLKGGSFSVSQCIRQPLVLPETLTIFAALQQFKAYGHDFALIVDEFGALQGLLSLQDVIRSITGELPADDLSEKKLYKLVALDDNGFEVDAGYDIDELNLHLEPPLPRSKRYSTLAGLILEKLQEIPLEGSAVELDGWLCEVIALDRRQIKTIRLHRKSE